ncbi:sensor domain-containing protein [Mycobacteroides abscessus]|uniref:sensor domain-containing protein n=1 Tax=Mycobacteroides abscessus TaxID=36809 RepID=UPI0019D1E329|nr:sensor domain-containing protein [Mycobacteroides abscessus]MBN7385451.1 sensor domain-containing protein [Mycobacteroides abscessus subsp. abscessus]MBN7414356.1 sensor domain-containing protein [Mycobacteroides abscessus subsp. abscessus]
MDRALPAAALLVAVLTGCSGTVEGQAVKPSASAVAASARTFAQVLPDEPAMSETLGSPMKNPYPRPPGGLSALPDGTGGATPIECVGVRNAAMRQSFEGAAVRTASESTWHTRSPSTMFPVPDFDLTLGVVELDTPEHAQNHYAVLVTRWTGCQGRTVVQHNFGGSGKDLTDEITQVNDTHGMLTSVVMESAFGDRPSPNQRALTVASRYVIDVRISDSSWHTGDPIGADKAVAVARMVAERINSTA